MCEEKTKGFVRPDRQIKPTRTTQGKASRDETNKNLNTENVRRWHRRKTLDWVGGERKKENSDTPRKRRCLHNCLSAEKDKKIGQGLERLCRDIAAEHKKPSLYVGFVRSSKSHATDGSTFVIRSRPVRHHPSTSILSTMVLAAMIVLLLSSCSRSRSRSR